MEGMIVGYVRVSTTAQAESAASQRRTILAYAMQHQLKVDRFFTDIKTGRTDQREGYQEMLELVKAGKVKMVIVWQINRLSRRASDGTAVLEFFKEHGVQLVSIMESGLGDDPAGDLLRNIMVSFGAFYSHALAVDVKRGMKSTAERGLWVGGKPPFGYIVNAERHLEVEPEQAQVVKLIYRMYATGRTVPQIQKELAVLGYTSASNKSFSKTSIRDMLHNMAYAGRGAWNKRKEKVGGHGNSHALKNEADWISFSCPQIVDPQTWELVQQRLAQNRSGKSRAKRAYPLSGAGIRCSCCGSAMVGEMNSIGKGKAERGYFCSGRNNRPGSCRTKAVRADAVEAEVCKALQCIFSIKPIISELTRQVNAAANEKRHKDGRLELLQANRDQVTGEIDQLLSAIKDGVRAAPVLRALDEAEQKRETILAAIEKEQAARSVPAFSVDDVMCALSELPKILQDLSKVEMTREMLKHYVERIEIDNQSVTIALRTPEQAKKM